MSQAWYDDAVATPKVLVELSIFMKMKARAARLLQHISSRADLFLI